MCTALALSVFLPSCLPPPPHPTKQLLSLRHTLALLLVAAWWQGEAVSPIDVARWALDGRLPYLAFAAEEGAELEQYNSILGRMLTSAKGA
jgi:hypothetical protein